MGRGLSDLTGRWRFTMGRITGRPILEVEESYRTIKSLRRPPGEDNTTERRYWRKARMEDLYHPSLRRLIDPRIP